MHNNNRNPFKSLFNHIARYQGFDLTIVHVEHNDDLANECIMQTNSNVKCYNLFKCQLLDYCMFQMVNQITNRNNPNEKNQN